MDQDIRPYRHCVGILLINCKGQVLVGARNDVENDNWQMPQGGIDEGEEPREAAFREMEEEIGTRNAELVSEYDEWIYYKLPPIFARKSWQGKYQGQKQRWFAFRFLGSDDEININTKNPEFKKWRWAELEEISGQTVEFKRLAYEKVCIVFRGVVNNIKCKKDSSLSK